MRGITRKLIVNIVGISGIVLLTPYQNSLLEALSLKEVRGVAAAAPAERYDASLASKSPPFPPAKTLDDLLD
jgi:hypothetical protein